jgi:hypothetical protein
MADREAGAGRAETEPAPGGGHVRDHRAFHPPGCPLIGDRRGDRPGGDVPRRGQRGLVAPGLIATAAGVRTAFYAFALIRLPTLVFVGLATFNRVLQSGIEDLGYASRIARLRDYHLQYAAELAGYLLSVPPAERLRLQGSGVGAGRSS